MYMVHIEYINTNAEYPEWSTIFTEYYSNKESADKRLAEVSKEPWVFTPYGQNNSWYEFDCSVAKLMVYD